MFLGGAAGRSGIAGRDCGMDGAMLLEQAATNPDARLSDLIAKLAEADKQHHDQQIRGFKQARSRMLKKAIKKSV